MMRSLLYVPAHSERFVSKAHQRGADAIILDLEDSVPAEHKLAAREGLTTTVEMVRRGGARVFVRINADARGEEDAIAACRAGADGLYVPKVQSDGGLARLDASLAPVEEEMGRARLGVVAILEDPASVLDARDIARSPRLIGLTLGGEDLALSLGANPNPDVLRFPKLMVHYAAKAAGLLSIGMLRSTADYSDHEGLLAAAREAKAHGFDGASCVHPAVVPLLNAGFSPSAEEVDWAERVVERARGGEGAFELDGRMVDAPVIARAKIILARR